MKTQPLLAEFLGTFFLCFAGIAAILSATPLWGLAPGLWASRSPTASRSSPVGR
jgi:glycerol uptake facilitator-like aquaporin